MQKSVLWRTLDKSSVLVRSNSCVPETKYRQVFYHGGVFFVVVWPIFPSHVPAKVIGLLRRIEEDGEPMSADSVFSPSDEENLYDLDCWFDFSFAPAPKKIGVDPTEDGEHGDDKCVGVSDGGRNVEGEMRVGGIEGGDTVGEEEDGVAAEGEVSRGRLLEQETRRQEAAGVASWLRSIESRLVEKCASVCDVAWYELGEPITYQGRPVAHSLPHGVMEAAMQRREEREDLEERRKRGR